MAAMKKYTPPVAGTWLQEVKEIADVFRMWGVTDYSAEPNVPLGIINRQYANRSECAVTVKFVKDGKLVTLSMDDYQYPPLNLKVLRLCLDDMRMIERRGVSNTMQSAYMQLAGPAGPIERDPWEVLGLRRGASRELVEAAYLALAKERHPDKTSGSEAAMKELNAAREKLLAQLVIA